ncbi:MAG TPA: endolytic transglycosylase MltG, partial [Streptosporangiaceae bacterium]|nr:endolytic transglycosylase MltG [Streptosporangiaceae bacterium]
RGGRPNRRGGGRPRRRGRRFRAPLIALLVIGLLLSGGGVVGYHFLRQYVIPPDYSGSGYGTVVVQVKQNQTATDVAKTLFGLGVVASPRAFVKAAEQSSQPTALEPGFYRLHLHMKASLAFDLLLNPGSRIQLKVTIPEGLRASQIVATLGAKSRVPLADYRAALANPAALGLPSYARNQPEGYLFPATYSVQPRMAAADVLRAMVAQFNAEAARINLVSTAQSVNLTPAEAIIVASLVQAEGGRLTDFPKIARVIYNRLAAGMPLQLDSTVMYALHTYGILATNQQLQVNSPYNTYQHTGLPPGPIDSPGDAAIHAALHPAVGNWLYFVTVNPKTGLTEFTSDPAVFDQLRAELAKNLAHGG